MKRRIVSVSLYISIGFSRNCIGHSANYSTYNSNDRSIRKIGQFYHYTAKISVFIILTRSLYMSSTPLLLTLCLLDTEIC